MAEALIVRVIHRYNPGWVAPADTGKTWLKTVCAFHLEDHASAAVSYELDSYSCKACPARGNAVTLLAQQEGMSNRDAARLAKELFMGGDTAVPVSPPRIAGRRIPFQPGTHRPGGREVRSGIRQRTRTFP